MMEEWMKPEIVWLVVGLLLMLSEFLVPGLVVFFFGLGALLVALCCGLTEIGLNAQILVFVGSSLAFLILLRRFVAQVFTGVTTVSGEAGPDDLEVVGEHAVTLTEIAPVAGGKVEFHGTAWKACSERAIPAGTPVEIVARRNLELVVKAL